jgi:signal transduction histidine kinase
LQRVPGARTALHQSRAIQYAAAVFATFLGLFIRYLMTPEWGAGLPFITLYPAIAFSAWFGGFGPGVLSTAIGAVAVEVFWPTHFGGVSAAGDALAIVLFTAVGVFISALTRGLRESRRRAEHVAEELARARDEADRANRAKDEFLAIVAHELKQPISAMLPATALVRQRLEPGAIAPVERTLDVLDRQIAHLGRVVNDLLEASGIVRGQVTLESHPVNAVQVMRDAVDTIRPRAAERQQELIVELPDTEIVVDADPVRLQQVFLNVLSNATSYTPLHGKIFVKGDIDGARVTFSVRDTGDGIAAGDLSRIFGLFTRAAGRPEGGFGIGLAVARTLVELHGGKISAHSDGAGRGSEFRVALPLGPTTNGAPTAGAKRPVATSKRDRAGV